MIFVYVLTAVAGRSDNDCWADGAHDGNSGAKYWFGSEMILMWLCLVGNRVRTLAGSVDNGGSGRAGFVASSACRDCVITSVVFGQDDLVCGNVRGPLQN